MPQVSRFKVNPEISKRMYQILFDSLTRFKNRTDVFNFLNDILTPTEQVMISKRLATAVLLAKGYTYESIRDILKVSRSAVASVSNSLSKSGKGYRKVIDRLLRQGKIKNFLISIEEVLDIIPPKGGNWSEWRRKKWQRKLQKQRIL